MPERAFTLLIYVLICLVLIVVLLAVADRV